MTAAVREDERLDFASPRSDFGVATFVAALMQKPAIRGDGGQNGRDRSAGLKSRPTHDL